MKVPRDDSSAVEVLKKGLSIFEPLVTRVIFSSNVLTRAASSSRQSVINNRFCSCRLFRNSKEIAIITSKIRKSIDSDSLVSLIKLIE